MIRSKQENINTAAYWDKLYHKENQTSHKRLDQARLSELDRWIRIRFEELGHHPYILDAGCGLAEVERYFAKIFPLARFKGIDIGVETIQICQTWARAEASFEVASLPKLPYDKGAFDIAWCGETIEHLEDPEAAVRELARVTGGGGLVILSTPYRGRNRDPEHVWEFEPDDIARWGKEIGELVFLDCRLLEGWISMFGVIRKIKDGP